MTVTTGTDTANSTTANPGSDTLGEIDGVSTAELFGTIAELGDDGDLAAFRFSARNRWVEGTASASTIHEWYGAGTDQVHVQEFTFTADHPKVSRRPGATN